MNKWEGRKAARDKLIMAYAQPLPDGRKKTLEQIAEMVGDVSLDTVRRVLIKEGIDTSYKGPGNVHDGAIATSVDEVDISGALNQGFDIIEVEIDEEDTDIVPVPKTTSMPIFKALADDCNSLKEQEARLKGWLGEFEEFTSKVTGGQRKSFSGDYKADCNYAKIETQITRALQEHVKAIEVYSKIFNNMYKASDEYKVLSTFVSVAQRILSKKKFMELANQVAIECNIPESVNWMYNR